MTDDTPTRRTDWRRLWPLALILAAFALAYAFGLQRYLSFEALAAHRAALAGFVAARPVASLLLYALAYMAVIAFSLPFGVVLTLAGGFLFGTWLGAAAAAASATLGACLFFLAARHALAETLARRGGPLLARVRQRMDRDGFWYLLSLRLVTVVPFWLVNLAAPLTGMRLLPFAAGTILGILPATTVFASIGAGLGQVFDAGRRPDLSLVFSPGILLPLLGLSALSLAGAWWRGRQRDA